MRRKRQDQGADSRLKQRRRRETAALWCLAYACLSALLPGAGQWAAGARHRAIALLAIVALPPASLGAVLGVWGADPIFTYLVRPDFLLLLIALNALLLGFRIFASWDAYRVGQRKFRKEGVAPALRLATMSVLLVTLLLVGVTPHALAGYYTHLSRDMLTEVFAASSSEEEDGANPGSTNQASTSIAGPAASPGAVTARPPETTPPPETTTSTEPLPDLEAGQDRRLTILLLGTDAGQGRRGARADTIMVASMDLRRGNVALFGIPRNTGNLPLSGRAAEALGTTPFPDMIGNLYGVAGAHPELAPQGGDPGAEVLADVAEELLGLSIDYYAVVNMGGFVDLVDALGGIKLNVKKRLNVRLSPPREGEEYRTYDIPPGIQHLDGHQALAFARSRTGSSDYDRMRRQRCVLKAILYQNGPAELALRLPKLVEVIRDNLVTNIPLDALPALAGLRSEVDTGRMLTVGFGPPDYVAGRNEKGYNILDRELVQGMVKKMIQHPEELLDAQTDSTLDDTDCWKVDE
ncbi:MAG: hypothetical protein Kow00129_15250 [Thermoleophilia bacterium]